MRDAAGCILSSVGKIFSLGHMQTTRAGHMCGRRFGLQALQTPGLSGGVYDSSIKALLLLPHGQGIFSLN